jgi:hypothetical protein
MINRIKFLLPVIFMLAVTLSANAYNPLKPVIDPHDSLLFDGETIQTSGFNLILDKVECYTRVLEVQGNVLGKVLTKEVYNVCGENETVYTVTERFLKKGDMLMHGSEVTTGVDSKAKLGVFLMERGFNSIFLTVGPESHITTPDFVTNCKVRLKEKEQVPDDEIKVIQGVVTYDAEPDAGFKAVTKGKRSTAKHTKTRYSHEVKIDGGDTVDVIRVYKGSVEVTFMKTDVSDDENMTVMMQKLSEDMLSGKLTAEEVQAKMTEFQNYGQNLNELITPVNVDEGFKCTVTKNSRKVEPLGAGDEDLK